MFMFDKIKNYLKEKKIIKRKKDIYNFDENEENQAKKLGKINFFDRIKFIRFNNKNKNPDVNVQKIKEARTFSCCSCTCWNWIY